MIRDFLFLVKLLSGVTEHILHRMRVLRGVGGLLSPLDYIKSMLHRAGLLSNIVNVNEGDSQARA